MTLIQGYQINLNSISGFVQSIATGTGTAGNYYPSNNPSGFITSGQTGQFQPSGNYYPSSNPSGFVTSISGAPATTYFGLTGISISGSGIWNINLSLNQGILTNRISVNTGNYTGNFIIGSGNAFPGAIMRFNFHLYSGTGYTVTISGLNSSEVVTQPSLGIDTRVYLEYSYDGTKWHLDQWV